MQTTGVVFRIFTKQFPGKGGKPGNTWYSIKLEGNDTYFRCKANNPGSIEGKTVTLEHDPPADGQANVTAAPVIVEAKAQAQTEQASGQGSSVGTGAILGTAREASIHYQSARKDALQFLDILTRTGAVKLPAKEANKLEALEALADSYTSRFFSDISTFGAVARANGTDGGDDKEETKPESEDEE